MWTIYLVFWAAAVFCFTMALVRIVRMKRCTEIVNGWFLETVRIIRIKNSTTKAKFFYEYDGKEYHGLTDLGLSNKRIIELSKGRSYRLYVNPKKPSEFAYDKKLTLINEISLLISGILFFIFPIALQLYIRRWMYF